LPRSPRPGGVLTEGPVPADVPALVGPVPSSGASARSSPPYTAATLTGARTGHWINSGASTGPTPASTPGCAHSQVYAIDPPAENPTAYTRARSIKSCFVNADSTSLRNPMSLTPALLGKQHAGPAFHA